MKAVHIAKYGRTPVLKDLPVPGLQQNDLLIKMKYAPVNPSDLNFYLGRYGIKKQGFPIVGFEGSGIIEQAKNKQLIGKKVSVTANMANGTHASHIISSINEVIVWPDNADLQAISMVFVNPLSCIGLCQIVEREKPENVLISAAASQIGRMIIASLRNKDQNLKIYGINRSNNKGELLTQLGITETIIIDDQMGQKLKKLKGKSIFLDSVGGSFAGKVFNTLGPESQMICYGKQSGEDLGGIDMGGLYYADKVIRGFWLNNWLKNSSKDDIVRAKNEVAKNFETLYKSSVRKVYKIENFSQAYHASTKQKSQGKILLQLS